LNPVLIDSKLEACFNLELVSESPLWNVYCAEVSLRNKWENLGAENDKLREQKKQYFDIR